MNLPIYLDHHATTPCDPRVVDAMIPYFTERFGNAASRTHLYGFLAKTGVDRARDQIAAKIGAQPSEIVLTSGATESDNLAILGVADALRDKRRHLVTAATEHKAVLDPMKHLASRGFEVTVLPVDSEGRISLDQLRDALRPDTALVSLMLANNEIGTIHPVAEAAAICRERGVFFHTDAAQAAGRIPIDVEKLGCDLISLSAHKVYGPKGVGALWVRRRPKPPIVPLFHGGGHERGLRSGTLPVPLVVGFGTAMEIGGDPEEGARIRALRDRLWEGLSASIPGIQLNGPSLGQAGERLGGNLNCAFPGLDGEALMLATKEIAVSTGSACTSATLEPSHVLRAIGLDPDLARGSIRFGLGRGTTAADVETTIDRYAKAAASLRAMSL